LALAVIHDPSQWGLFGVSNEVENNKNSFHISFDLTASKCCTPHITDKQLFLFDLFLFHVDPIFFPRVALISNVINRAK